MTDQPNIPNVSMANTKKELLEAYEEAKKRVQSIGKDLLDAEKARKQMEKQVAAATADTQAAQDPVKRLNDLRGSISRELNDLAERFETEIDTYRKIQAAIDAKQKELETLYGVESAASDLAALIDAQRIKKEAFENAMVTQKSAFEADMQSMRAQWQREKADHDREVKEQAAALETQRQREKETYQYAYNREKEQRKNELEDQLQALEKELAAKRAEFENETQQRTAGLDHREIAIVEREKQMADLQKEVETFPKRSDAAVQAAVNDTTQRLNDDFENTKALMEARFEGQKNVLLGKVEALEKTVASQATQIVDLSKKSEQAYEKVQDIANRAVTASRREHYHQPAPQLTVPVRDDGKG